MKARYEEAPKVDRGWEWRETFKSHIGAVQKGAWTTEEHNLFSDTTTRAGVDY